MPDGQPSNGPRMPMGFLVAGTEMASFTLLGVVLDFALGTLPGFTIGLTLIGVAAAFFQLMKMAKALTGKKPNPTTPPDEGAA